MINIIKEIKTTSFREVGRMLGALMLSFVIMGFFYPIGITETSMNQYYLYFTMSIIGAGLISKYIFNVKGNLIKIFAWLIILTLLGIFLFVFLLGLLIGSGM